VLLAGTTVKRATLHNYEDLARKDVRVGDTVACYARVERIGRTSMTIPVEVWVTRYMTGEQLRVTHGVFTYVAVDHAGKPMPVKHEPA